MRQVTLGPVEGEKVSILDGIQAHDKIITGNLQKIGPGMPVRPLPTQEKQADAGQ
jgi:multidrug efflux system membrane fusion protein